MSINSRELIVLNNAVNTYYELQRIVTNCNKTLEQLCEELGGHNLEEDLFDLNYKEICATIRKNKYGQPYLTNSVEVWYSDGNDSYLITDDLTIEEKIKWDINHLRENYVGDSLFYGAIKNQVVAFELNHSVSKDALEEIKTDCDLMNYLSWIVFEYENGNDLYEEIYNAYYDSTKQKFMDKYFTKEEQGEIFE